MYESYSVNVDRPSALPVIYNGMPFSADSAANAGKGQMTYSFSACASACGISKQSQRFVCIVPGFRCIETYVVACITAVFTPEDHPNERTALRQTPDYGQYLQRGGFDGLYFYLPNLWPDSNHRLQPAAIPLVIMLIIALLVRFGYQEGTVGACATLLTILFMIPAHESYLSTPSTAYWTALSACSSPFW